MAEPLTCARYFGSDGTLCSTHNGRFASDTTMRCDRNPPAVAEPLTPKHDRWHESGCATCTALDPLLLALNDIDHVDGAERDLIVRLAGGALDAARAAAPLDVERLAYVHHLTDTDDPGRAEQPWRECPWSKEHSAFAAEYARLGEDARRG